MPLSAAQQVAAFVKKQTTSAASRVPDQPVYPTARQQVAAFLCKPRAPAGNATAPAVASRQVGGKLQIPKRHYFRHLSAYITGCLGVKVATEAFSGSQPTFTTDDGVTVKGALAVLLALAGDEPSAVAGATPAEQALVRQWCSTADKLPSGTRTPEEALLLRDILAVSRRTLPANEGFYGSR